jgi:hypothetical protein
MVCGGDHKEEPTCTNSNGPSNSNPSNNIDQTQHVPLPNSLLPARGTQLRDSANADSQRNGNANTNTQQAQAQAQGLISRSNNGLISRNNNNNISDNIPPSPLHPSQLQGIVNNPQKLNTAIKTRDVGSSLLKSKTCAAGPAGAAQSPKYSESQSPNYSDSQKEESSEVCAPTGSEIEENRRPGEEDSDVLFRLKLKRAIAATNKKKSSVMDSGMSNGNASRVDASTHTNTSRSSHTNTNRRVSNRSEQEGSLHPDDIAAERGNNTENSINNVGGRESGVNNLGTNNLGQGVAYARKVMGSSYLSGSNGSSRPSPLGDSMVIQTPVTARGDPAIRTPLETLLPGESKNFYNGNGTIYGGDPRATNVSNLSTNMSNNFGSNSANAMSNAMSTQFSNVPGMSQNNSNGQNPNGQNSNGQNPDKNPNSIPNTNPGHSIPNTLPMNGHSNSGSFGELPGLIVSSDPRKASHTSHISGINNEIITRGANLHLKASKGSVNGSMSGNGSMNNGSRNSSMGGADTNNYSSFNNVNSNDLMGEVQRSITMEREDYAKQGDYGKQGGQKCGQKFGSDTQKFGSAEVSVTVDSNTPSTDEQFTDEQFDQTGWKSSSVSSSAAGSPSVDSSGGSGNHGKNYKIEKHGGNNNNNHNQVMGETIKSRSERTASENNNNNNDRLGSVNKSSPGTAAGAAGQNPAEAPRNDSALTYDFAQSADDFLKNFYKGKESFAYRSETVVSNSTQNPHSSSSYSRPPVAPVAPGPSPTTVYTTTAVSPVAALPAPAVPQLETTSMPKTNSMSMPPPIPSSSSYVSTTHKAATSALNNSIFKLDLASVARETRNSLAHIAGGMIGGGGGIGQGIGQGIGPSNGGDSSARRATLGSASVMLGNHGSSVNHGNSMNHAAVNSARLAAATDGLNKTESHDESGSTSFRGAGREDRVGSEEVSVGMNNGMSNSNGNNPASVSVTNGNIPAGLKFAAGGRGKRGGPGNNFNGNSNPNPPVTVKQESPGIRGTTQGVQHSQETQNTRGTQSIPSTSADDPSISNTSSNKGAGRKGGFGQQRPTAARPTAADRMKKKIPPKATAAQQKAEQRVEQQVAQEKVDAQNDPTSSVNDGNDRHDSNDDGNGNFHTVRVDVVVMDGESAASPNDTIPPNSDCKITNSGASQTFGINQMNQASNQMNQSIDSSHSIRSNPQPINFQSFQSAMPSPAVIPSTIPSTVTVSSARPFQHLSNPGSGSSSGGIMPTTMPTTSAAMPSTVSATSLGTGSYNTGSSNSCSFNSAFMNQNNSNNIANIVTSRSFNAASHNNCHSSASATTLGSARPNFYSAAKTGNSLGALNMNNQDNLNNNNNNISNNNISNNNISNNNNISLTSGVTEPESRRPNTTRPNNSNVTTTTSLSANNNNVTTTTSLSALPMTGPSFGSSSLSSFSPTLRAVHRPAQLPPQLPKPGSFRGQAGSPQFQFGRGFR